MFPGWFTDAVIARIAQQTGSEYKRLAILLDFTDSRLEQICHKHRQPQKLENIVDVMHDVLLVQYLSFIKSVHARPYKPAQLNSVQVLLVHTVRSRDSQGFTFSHR